MKIEILGTGCAKCNKLEELVREAVGELGVDAEIIKITDLNEILEYDIMMTPGLVVDGEIVCSGRLPKKDEILSWLQG
ncbi:MAG: thioredoxin family protein [Syntrophaceticus sp.]|jgi:small redox-active disulfide protein 2|nr:thioredoxin family protein [Syntrophaceticus sp.]HBG23149.1 redox-active disulfide protein 2 [Peptococcaceae bacterium]MDD3314566.1 thioredoxin family protein [Syntrophaceticus sp.]MDD4359788.1 thioredoxin family protein [Syntrophaceticus sp.]MDD4782899.1 thioredoxin family protein [Syntrophaceticus sp.]